MEDNIYFKYSFIFLFGVFFFVEDVFLFLCSALTNITKMLESERFLCDLNTLEY